MESSMHIVKEDEVKAKRVTLLLGIGILILCGVSFALGMNHIDQQVKSRALEMNKSCYDGFDIQYIVTGVKDKQQHNE